MTPAERHRQVVAWNSTAVDYPEPCNLAELLEAQAHRTPDAVALTFAGASLSYRQLHRAADRLAGRLRRLGVGPEVQVGVLMERSLEMVVALVAVIKAGGAYVPLDPDYPEARLAFMLEDFRGDCPGAIVLTQERIAGKLGSAAGVRVIPLDRQPLKPGTRAGTGPPPEIRPDSLAYVIYTSGSTGQPKGAMNTHGAIRNRLLWMQQAFSLGAGDCVLQKTPFSFDVSVWEFFWPLIVGSRLLVAAPGGHKESGYLVELIARERVTTIHFVPPMLQAFLADPGCARAKCLERVIVSGEALPHALERRFFDLLPAELHNLYGPTEAAIDVTHWPCRRGSEDPVVPIGGPIANIRLRVLDSDLDLLPTGEAGELLLGGVGLARGYHRRAGLTAERFVPDPYADVPGERLYRTGDLVRWRKSGDVEFLGRIDFQVKLRGFRIELGEIEAVLGAHPGLREVVVALRDVAGDPRLVAYAVPGGERALPVRKALQLARRAELGNGDLYELPNGMVVAHRNRAETDFLYQEIFAEETYLRHGVTLSDGDCVFDAGANVGLFSLFAASRAREVKVFAFEPIPEVHRTARLNAELYGLDAEVQNVGLAERSGSAELTYYPHVSLVSGRFADLAEERAAVMSVLRRQLEAEAAGELTRRDLEELVDERLRAETVTCELRTVSEVMREHCIERIDLLKVDVEKSELEVLAGIAAEDWPRIRQVVVEVHDVGGRVETVRRLLEDQGFRVVAEQDEMLHDSRLFNLYAVRPGDRPEASRQAPGSALDGAWSWASERRLTADLRALAAAELPDYMVPAHFVLLPEMPLTPNGKVDRTALAAEALPDLDAAAGSTHAAPRNATETRLAELFAQLLGARQVSIEERFFDLGGHSLLAAQLAARARRDFDVELTSRDVFERPTVAALAAWIDQLAAGEGAGDRLALPPIRRGNRDQRLPLAFQQRQIFFLDRLVPDSIAYNAQFTVSLHGDLEVEVLEAALSEVVRRHEVLRTTFVEIGGEPEQRIHSPWKVQVPVVDFSRLEPEKGRRRAEQLALEVVRRRFDVGRLPLIAWTLARIAEDEHLLIHVEHHFVHDGWSIGVFLRETMALYEAFLAGRPSPLADLPVQYADYALWQREWMRDEVLESRLDFWRRELAGCPLVLDLPTDRPRPPEQTFRGARLDANLPADLYADLRTASRREGVTLFMTMLAAFQVLLYRTSGQAEFVTGCGVGNRPLPETEPLIGMLVNTIVLRADLRGDPTFRELRSRVREITLRAQEAQDLPFDRLVESLQPPRDRSRNPVFQYMFSFHDSPLPDVDFAGLEGRLLERPNGSAKADFNVIFRPRAEQRVGRGASDEDALMRVLWEYSTDLFDAATVERFWGRYQVLLRAAVERPDLRISEMPLLTAAEQRQLRDWNRTAVELPAAAGVHELFQRRADADPDALAAAGEGSRLSYGELERRANRLAHHLIALGVGPGVPVAVCMSPSPELLAALLAVLEAGGAYLPLDPVHPRERLAYTLEDSGARVLLTEESLRGVLPETAAAIVTADGELPEAPASRPPSRSRPDDLAYVIYTSGSTGRPKGTELTHRGLLNLVAWHCRAYDVKPGDRAAKTASLAFDASVWEIWPYLAAGASLHFPPDAVRADPAPLYRWLAAEAIDLVFLATPVAEAILREPVPAGLALRALLTGGDKLHRFPKAPLPFRLINHYGPTESTVVATCAEVPAQGPRETSGAPPIGRPIANLRVHVVDRRLNELPVGVPGELLLGGVGLARSYLGHPRLTAECFIPDPYAPTRGARLYRTGDLARWLPAGELEFIGRIDHQVKVRGLRIELGEIEAVLGEHPRVGQAAAIVHERGGEQLLAAFYVAAGEAPSGGTDTTEPPAEELAAWLQRKLPQYMVPGSFIRLDELPVSPNGKVDRAALARQAEDHLAAAAPADGAERVAPSDPREHRLAEIWSQTLGVDEIGVHDTFFALGGHSLLAIRLLSRVQEAFGVELELSTLFEWPTVAGMAAAIAEARPGGGRPPLVPATARELRGGAPLSFAQERLWFLDRFIPVPAAYHIARAFRLRGALIPRALEQALSDLAARHEILRSRFPAGEGGAPAQVVSSPLQPALPRIDLRRLAGPARQAEARRRLRQASQRPFDLERGPLWRPLLLLLDDGEHLLLLTFHHIIFDGLSMALFLRQLGDRYAAALAGEASDLSAPALRYVDFASWQRRWLQGEALEDLLGYWRQQLDGVPTAIELPFDRPRPALQSFRGAQATLRLGEGLTAQLGELARESRTTPFMVLLAAFAALLGRVADTDDVVIGTPVAGRGGGELDALLGLFVNTLALRLRLTGDPSFHELLRRTRETTLGALAHRDLPFEKLVEVLRPERDLSHSPVFQVLFVFQDGEGPRPELPGLEVEPTGVERTEAQFDLMLFATVADGDCELVLRYDRELFDATTGARLVRYLAQLVTGIAAEPARPVTEPPLFAAAERQMLVIEHNDTAVAVPGPECLHELFAARAKRTPEAPAVVAPEEELTYGELDRRSNQLARHLRSLGAGPGSLVGVHCERSAAMLVAVLGILKSGAAYVPLETSWPPERIRWILEHEQIRLLVTQEARLAGLEPPPSLRAVCLDRDAEQLAKLPDGDLPPAATGVDLAYVIFTSGSTGKPKGVAVAHRPAMNLVRWVNGTFGVGAEDRLLFTSALSFDLSVYDIFGILAAGGSVRLAAGDELRDPERLARVLTEERITFWDSAPAALQQLVGFLPARRELRREPALRLIFLSGDWVPVALPDRLRRTFPQARLIALGGATEATVWSNYYPVGEVDPAWPSIPYGRPIDNARYHVLDRHFQPCPIGIAGDLYIGGQCLSMGYSRAPRRTAAQYLPDPLGGIAGGRLYRTGDRVRAFPDGNLQFLGRLDNQVKVRGFRIELGEIETVLGGHPSVREAVVLVREDTPGDQRLVAYYIPEAEPAPTSELRAWLARKLPEYMLPSAWLVLDQWPLASTGKLDRKALPEPEARRAEQETAGAAPASPRRALEENLAALWRRIIGIDHVTVDDNFFEIGGHSLLLVQLHAQLPEAVGHEVSMTDLFRYPTVRSLADFLIGDDEDQERPRAATARVAAAPLGSGVETREVEIAVIGMAGRFPDASDVEEFWRKLSAGEEMIRFFSDEELRAAGIHEELIRDPRFVRARGALDDAELFDAAFFGYPPSEARVLDPQQRHFLECAHQALEAAGYGASDYRERVGVYAGASANTYLRLLADSDLARSAGPFQVQISNNSDYLPTRVSYKLDLEGPSVNVQTACSTSLVAIHVACQALVAGDCDLALAGGASVAWREVGGHLYEEGGVQSPDGHTRTFDAAARGATTASGVGVVVLKRLAEARRDGDPIRAVVLGTASNNDGGQRQGFTAPSVEGQAGVILQAHIKAGVDPETITYVEAHGTGTELGDPIEVAGLTQAFRAGTEKRGYCALGSLKTNIGHLDAAAGVAGFIKTVSALEHRQIPPSLHFTTPNPKIDFEASPFYVNTALTDWPRGGAPRRAGVSAFGIGGTNAHVVLEEAPVAEPAEPSERWQLLPLSARTPAALDAMTASLAEHLEAHPELDLADVAYTLQVGRRALAHRRTIVCRHREQAVAALTGEASRQAFSGAADSGNPPVAFLFPGQGAQHAGMAMGVYRDEPVFRRHLDRCAEILERVAGLDLLRLLDPDSDASGAVEPDIDQTVLAQPALFAVEVSLARLWRHWGVKPEAMLGHSLGEYVAACVAGVFSLEEGLRLTALRGRLMQELPAGEMLSVQLEEQEAAALAEEVVPGRLAVATAGGPGSVVLSGDPEAVAAVVARLAERGVEHQRLHTSHAFHSPMMEPVLEPFRAELEGIDLRPPKIPYLSNLTGTWIRAEEATDPAYWCRHLRHTVRLGDDFDELFQSAGRLLLEVGPGRSLATAARRHPGRDRAGAILHSLPPPRAVQADGEAMMAALGRLWAAGVEIDWLACSAHERRRRVPLPTYPFERRRFWVDGYDDEDPAAEKAPAEAASEPRNDAERAVAEAFAEVLGVARVGREDDFFELGGSSLLALRLPGLVRSRLGAEMDPAALLEAPTAALLAESFAGDGENEEAAERPAHLVRLQHRGAGRPLFMVHPVGGTVYWFRDLARSLAPRRPFYALRSPGVQKGEEPLGSIREMAARYLEEVRRVQPHGPYFLGGSSMGGSVAFEMARQVQAAGEVVALLTLLDSPVLDQLPERPDDAEILASVFDGSCPLPLEELRRTPPDERLDRIMQAFENGGGANGGLDRDQAHRLFRVGRANVAALYAYEPEPLPLKALFFRARERRPGESLWPELAWVSLAGEGLEIQPVDGNHVSMNYPPHVEAVARLLGERLRNVEGR